MKTQKFVDVWFLAYATAVALILLLLIADCRGQVAAIQQFPPPLPVPPKQKGAGTTMKGAQKQMAMARASRMTAITAAIVAKPKVITLAADFFPMPALMATNCLAFIEVSTDLNNPLWLQFSLPYAPSGGTFAIPWTNAPGAYVFWRAGYQFNR